MWQLQRVFVAITEGCQTPLDEGDLEFISSITPITTMASCTSDAHGSLCFPIHDMTGTKAIPCDIEGSIKSTLLGI